MGSRSRPTLAACPHSGAESRLPGQKVVTLGVDDKAKVKIDQPTPLMRQVISILPPSLASHNAAVRIDDHERWEVAVPSRTYKVIVRGRLSPALVAACEGFGAADFDQGMTHLVGLVPDQQALHRLFRVLRDLNVDLESVNPVT